MLNKYAFLVIILLSSLASAYTIDGDVVYWENSWGKISQYPHTLDDIKNTVYLNITSYIDTPKQIDTAFKFDTTNIRPSKAEYWSLNAPHEVPVYGNVSDYVYCEGIGAIHNDTHVSCDIDGNVSYLYCPTPRWFTDIPHQCNYNVTAIVDYETQYWSDWVDISDSFEKIVNESIIYYYITNVTFNPDETKQLKITINAEPNTEGKYDLFMKLTEDTIAEAKASGRWVELDPWWDNDYLYRVELTFTGTGDNNIATPFFFDSGDLDFSHVETGCADCRYVTVDGGGSSTQRDIFIQKYNTNTNVSGFFEYASGETSHYLYYGKSGATSASNPNSVFDFYSNQTYDDSTNFTDLSTGAVCAGTYCTLTYPNGYYRASGSTAPQTLYSQLYFVAGTADAFRWGHAYGGSPARAYFWILQPEGTGGYTADWLSYKCAGSEQLNVVAHTLAGNTYYNYRSVLTATTMNLSFQTSSGKGELDGNVYNYVWSVGSCGLGSSHNPYVESGIGSSDVMRVYWWGQDSGDDTPTLTAVGSEEQNLQAPVSTASTACRSTDCSAISTVYTDSPNDFVNASGVCTDGDNATIQGYFRWYVNGSVFTMGGVTNFTTYSWADANTEYINSTGLLTVGYLNKSDTWEVGLTCFDLNQYSTENVSTAFTVNNTQPAMAQPEVNDTSPLNESTLFCINGTYSDADNDPQSTWGTWRWWLNGGEISGEQAQTLDLSTVSGGVSAGDTVNCSLVVADTGYSNMTTDEAFSNEVTVIASGSTTLTLRLFNSANSTAVSNWCANVTNSSISNYTCGNSNPTTYNFGHADIPTGVLNITFSTPDFTENATVSAVNFNSTDNAEFNATVWRYQYFTAINNATASTINSWTGTFYDGNGSFSEVTNNGTIRLPLYNFSYPQSFNMLIQATGYGDENFTINIDANSQLNDTYSMDTSGLSVIAYDESTYSRVYFDLVVNNGTDTNSTTYNYAFTGSYATTPHGAITLTVSNSSYFPRTYYSIITKTTNTTIDTYLLPRSADYRLTSFRVLTGAGATITNATVTISKQINSTWVNVGERLTDGSGIASFVMDTTVMYQIEVVYTGYEDFSSTITPAESIYTVYMSSSSSSYEMTFDFEDIKVAYYPKDTIPCESNVQFLFNTSSVNNSINTTGWTIYNGTTTLHTYNATNATGDSLTYTLLPSNTSNISIQLYILHNINGTAGFATILNNYVVVFCNNSLDDRASTEVVLDKVKTDSEAGTGLGSFTISLLVIIVSVMGAGFASRFGDGTGSLIYILLISGGLFVGVGILSAFLVFLANVIFLVAYEIVANRKGV